MLKRPLTRRYAPTSPSKRGEVNPHKLLPKKSRANIPESRHSVSARSSIIPSVCCESQFFPGTALPPAGRGWGSPGTPIAAYGNGCTTAARGERLGTPADRPPYDNFHGIDALVADRPLALRARPEVP